MKEIVISNMMRAKNKQSFFALHQIQSKIKNIYPELRIEFHILWDEKNEMNYVEDKKWSDLIDEKIENLHSYNRKFFNDYVKDYYKIDYTEKFDKWFHIYYVIFGQYLRRVKLKNYYFIYDDDVIINDDFKNIIDLALSNTAVLINEPMNVNCDKVLLQKLVNLFGKEFYDIYLTKNPNFLGFNAGFQGIDLSIYDDFLSADRFKFILDLFEYKSVYDENGKEIWGNERFFIDTQQQSFISLMNVVLSDKIHILNPKEYYVIPNWGTHPELGEINTSDENNGWTFALKSKITHFIGHTQGKGKPKEFLDRIDLYLKENGFL